jgi:hypothetical protein
VSIVQAARLQWPLERRLEERTSGRLGSGLLELPRASQQRVDKRGQLLRPQRSRHLKHQQRHDQPGTEATVSIREDWLELQAGA